MEHAPNPGNVDRSSREFDDLVEHGATLGLERSQIEGSPEVEQAVKESLELAGLAGNREYRIQVA